ncbi:hypothetical protein LCGC14_3119360, partial [marine sediment metagenome]
DTSSQFKGVDPATLTKEKGFPNYIRAIAEARITNEHLATLPNEKLVSLNADPNLKEPTFAQYHQMWADREKLVAAGDDAKITIEGETFKGKEAVEAFDKDERTKNAHRGNFSQRQFALLNEYWAIVDDKKQAEFLAEHKDEIGVKPRDEWLRSHPKENAELAVWGQAKILTKEAYTAFNSLVKELDIPDNAIPEFAVPPGDLAEDHFNYIEIVSEFGASSAEAKLFRLEHGELTKWGMATLGWDSNIGLRGIEYYRLQIKSRDAQTEYDAIEVTEDRQKYLEDNPEFRDDRRRMDAMEYQIPENQIEDYVEYYTIDRAGYEDDWFLMEHLDFYNTMVDFGI